MSSDLAPDREHPLGAVAGASDELMAAPSAVHSTWHIGIATAAISALAFIAACFAHEVAGHAIACLAGGGRVALLTSVYFHCASASGIATDLAGPAANLVLATVCCLLLRTKNVSPNARLFLVLSLAINLFWLAATMIDSAVLGSSDFAYLLQTTSTGWHGVNRVGLAFLGVLIYVRGLRAGARYAAAGTRFGVAYVSVGIVSCSAAVFYAGPLLPALEAAALESFAAMAGLLLLAVRNRRGAEALQVHLTGRLALACSMALVVFWATLGAGMPP